PLFEERPRDDPLRGVVSAELSQVFVSLLRLPDQQDADAASGRILNRPVARPGRFDRSARRGNVKRHEAEKAADFPVFDPRVAPLAPPIESGIKIFPA